MSKNVLFLGAGFSRPLGHPVMSEFFAHARGHAAMTPADKEWLADIQHLAREASGMLDGPHTNLEHVLSLALMDFAAMDTAKADRSSRYAQMVNLLFKVYRTCDLKAINGYRDRIKALLAFSEEANAPIGSDLTIITTNYDMNVETGLMRLGVLPKLPFAPTTLYRQQDQESIYSDNGPLLCKLHGSVNWFHPIKGTEPIKVEDRMGYIRNFEQDRQDRAPLIVGDTTYPDLRAILVPPMYFKHQIVPEMDANWAAAAKALRSAEKVAFVGYSFPPSDTHMRYFLASSLYKNVGLEAIHVVDPQAVAICERLKKGDYGTAIGRMLRPFEGGWHCNRVPLH